MKNSILKSSQLSFSSIFPLIVLVCLFCILFVFVPKPIQAQTFCEDICTDLYNCGIIDMECFCNASGYIACYGTEHCFGTIRTYDWDLGYCTSSGCETDSTTATYVTSQFCNVNDTSQSSSEEYFLSSVDPSVRTIYSGNSTTYTVTITPQSGYTGTVNLSVASCPANATCSLSPSSVNITSTGSQSSTLTVVANSGIVTGNYTVSVNSVDSVDSSTNSSVTASLVIIPNPYATCDNTWRDLPWLTSSIYVADYPGEYYSAAQNSSGVYLYSTYPMNYGVYGYVGTEYNKCTFGSGSVCMWDSYAYPLNYLTGNFADRVYAANPSSVYVRDSSTSNAWLWNGSTWSNLGVIADPGWNTPHSLTDSGGRAWQFQIINPGTANAKPQYKCAASYLLTVAKSGSGTGTVTSNPSGISCDVSNTDCTESYSSGTSVTLTASAASGSTFSGWSGGGCSGTGTCTVAMSAAQTVTATFTTSSAISVTLTASPTTMTLPTNSTTLTWVTTGSPTSCTASGSWSGSKSASGGTQIMTGLTAQTYTYTITCSKAGSSNAVSSASVTVNPAGGGSCDTSVPWYNSSWAYRNKITINESMIPGATAISNFPVLIDTTISGAQSDGDDILFTASDGITKLSHEIEYFGSNHLIAWVKVPSLSATVNTVLYVYYGNGSASDQQNETDVWSNGFVGVWHLPNGSTLSSANSVSGANGTISGSVATAGKTDGAASFDGIDDKITSDVTSHSSQRTYSIWSYRTGAGGSSLGRLFDKRVSGTTVEQLYNHNGSTYSFERFFTDGTAQWSISAPSSSVWHYTVVTYDSSSTSNDPKIYTDGILQTLTYDVNRSGTLLTNPDAFVIGNRGNDNARAWSGRLDEFRIANSIRSADWITTEYNNQNSPSSYETFASQEDYASCSASATVNISANPLSILSGNSTTISWSSSNAASCSISPNGWTGTSGSQTTTLTSSRTFTASCLPGPVTANVTVTVQVPHDLNIIKTGQGIVTGSSNPPQTNISCGSVCQASYADATIVTLTATPNQGRIFTGWSGDCSGTGTCTLTIDGDKTVLANFIVDPNFREF